MVDQMIPSKFYLYLRYKNVHGLLNVIITPPQNIEWLEQNNLIWRTVIIILFSSDMALSAINYRLMFHWNEHQLS